MKAFLYTGGRVFPDGICERPAPADPVIAADAGWKTACLMGVTPSLLVGDFDSLGALPESGGTEILRVPAEKDDTDTQLAVRIALERGATELCIIGGMSGRVDHTLSSLAVLEDLNRRGIPAILTDGQNRARFLRNGSLLLPRAEQFRYLSLITATEKATGVTLEGCKYPLRNATLTRRNQYAVSNEIAGSCALISVRHGGIYIIESSDRTEA